MSGPTANRQPLSLSRTLITLADLAEVRGAGEEAALLRRAGAVLEGADERAIERDLREGRVPAGPGLSADVIDRLQSIARTGTTEALRAAIDAMPRDLQRLLSTPGVDVADVALLHRTLGILTRGDLAIALERGEVDRATRLPPEKVAALRAALATLRPDAARIPLGRAHALTDAIVETLERECLDLWQIVVVGSLRRGAALVGDVELVAVAGNPVPVIECFIGLPNATRVLHRSDTKASVEFGRLPATLRVVPVEELGPAIVHHTGSAAHVRALVGEAERRGLVLTPTSLTQADGSPVAASLTEKQVYDRIGLPFVPPELRESGTEVAAAAEGRLPRLVSRQDIRGDLHMHSTWSDGRDPIEVMARVAQDLGYEYIAITDHSKSSSIANGLTVERLLQQFEEIELVRRLVPGVTILQGCEVDILPDGSLDYPDEVLEQLDVVLASLHDPAGQTGAELTDRYIRAMHNPLVNIITHPTNRLLGHRDGYDLDFDALFRAAVETGTVLEIDGAPAHIDMDGALARRAVAAGVMVAINSDCHRAEWLDRQMGYGVATARRGWVGPDHVINALPLYELAAMFASKRS